MPYCVGCGVRVDAGVVHCQACAAKAAGRRVCARCGLAAGSASTRFCVGCGAPFEGGPAVSADLSAPVTTVAAPAPGGDAKAAGLVEAARRERQAVYQRLGRSLLAACYQGKLPYDVLPMELRRQTEGGIAIIRRGHAVLVQAGICPRCLEPALSGELPVCGRCGLRVPPAGAGPGGA